MKTYLNLFAGHGGNTELLDRSLFEVTHVETDPKRIELLKEKFPGDKIIGADAYQYLLDHVREFDIIWASPPCTTHSSIRWSNRNKPNFKNVYPDLKLYQVILFLQRAHDLWIVENVVPYYDPLIKPKAKVGRHLVWASHMIKDQEFPTDNIIHIDKDLRDRMNPEIGLYLLSQVSKGITQDNLENYIIGS